MFEKNPALNDTLTKLILVDSKGQHKNERNANRLGEAAVTSRKKIASPRFEDQEDEEIDLYGML